MAQFHGCANSKVLFLMPLQKRKSFHVTGACVWVVCPGHAAGDRLSDTVHATASSNLSQHDALSLLERDLWIRLMLFKSSCHCHIVVHVCLTFMESCQQLCMFIVVAIPLTHGWSSHTPQTTSSSNCAPTPDRKHTTRDGLGQPIMLFMKREHGATHSVDSRSKSGRRPEHVWCWWRRNKTFLKKQRHAMQSRPRKGLAKIEIRCNDSDWTDYQQSKVNGNMEDSEKKHIGEKMQCDHCCRALATAFSVGQQAQVGLKRTAVNYRSRNNVETPAQVKNKTAKEHCDRTTKTDSMMGGPMRVHQQIQHRWNHDAKYEEHAREQGHNFDTMNEWDKFRSAPRTIHAQSREEQEVGFDGVHKLHRGSCSPTYRIPRSPKQKPYFVMISVTAQRQTAGSTQWPSLSCSRWQKSSWN